MTAVTGSGIRVMSDSLIAFQPAIDEPSNITPSEKVSPSMIDTSKVTCCHLPRGSVKRKSTYLTSLSLIALSTSLAVFILSRPLFCPGKSDAARWAADLGSDGVGAGLAGADADRFLDARYKNLAIADPAGLGRLADRLDGVVDEIVVEHDLELHLRQEIDHVLGPAIELGVALLPAEAFRLDHGDALQPDLLQRLFDLVELERFDDGFDLLHRRSLAGARPIWLRSAALSINADDHLRSPAPAGAAVAQKAGSCCT